MRRWLCSVVFVYSFVVGLTTAKGQVINQHKIDSLQLLLKNANGIDSCEILFEIAYEHLELNNEKVLEIVPKACEIAKHYGDTIKLIKSQRILGQALRRLNRYEEAKQVLLEILPVAQKKMSSDRNLMMIYNTLALVYTIQGYYDKGLYYNFKSLEMKERSRDKAGVCVSYNNIGLLYSGIDNFDKAISYYVKSIKLNKEIGYNYDLDRALINLSLCYAGKRQFAMARKCLREAIVICNGYCSLQKEIEGEYANGIIYFGERNYKDAERSFLKSYKVSLVNGDTRFQMENLECLIKLSIINDNLELARRYLQRTDVLAKDLKLNTIQVRIKERYVELYKKYHDYKNMARFQMQYVQLCDSLYSQRLTQNLLVIQTEYEQRDNNAEIKSQANALALKEEVIDKQNALTIVASAAIVLLGLLVFVLYRNSQHKKSINSMLEWKVAERTKELQFSTQLVQKAYREQGYFIMKTTDDFRHPLSKIKKLSSYSLEKLRDDRSRQCFMQLNSTANQLQGLLNRLNGDVDG